MLETDVSGVQFLADNFYRSSEVSCLLKLPCCLRTLPCNKSLLREHFRLIHSWIPTVTFKGFHYLEKGV